MSERNRFFKRTDLIVIAVILAISAVAWLAYNSAFSGRPAKAEIYYNSRLVATIELKKGEEKHFSIPGKENVVFYLDKEGNIRFERSDCPDKVCINAGKLHIVGQSAACLPNGLVLKIVPAGERDDDDLDAVG